jgi:hypothetical protein
MAADLLRDPERLLRLKTRALQRAGDFRPESIMNDMLRDLGLSEGAAAAVPAPARPYSGRSRGKRKNAPVEMPLEQNQAFLGELLALMGG